MADAKSTLKKTKNVPEEKRAKADTAAGLDTPEAKAPDAKAPEAKAPGLPTIAGRISQMTSIIPDLFNQKEGPLKTRIDELSFSDKLTHLGKQFSKEEKDRWWDEKEGKRHKIGLIRNKELDILIKIFSETFDFSKKLKKHDVVTKKFESKECKDSFGADSDIRMSPHDTAGLVASGVIAGMDSESLVHPDQDSQDSSPAAAPAAAPAPLPQSEPQEQLQGESQSAPVAKAPPPAGRYDLRPRSPPRATQVEAPSNQEEGKDGEQSPLPQEVAEGEEGNSNSEYLPEETPSSESNSGYSANTDENGESSNGAAPKKPLTRAAAALKQKAKEGKEAAAKRVKKAKTPKKGGAFDPEEEGDDGFDRSDIEEMDEIKEPLETIGTVSDFERLYLGWLNDPSIGEISDEESQKRRNSIKSLFRFIFGTKDISDVTATPCKRSSVSPTPI